MTTEEPKLISPADLVGYSQMFESCERLVAASPHPKLAAVALMNATICIALGALGRERLESDLRQAIENLPMAEAKARGRMS